MVKLTNLKEIHFTNPETGDKCIMDVKPQWTEKQLEIEIEFQEKVMHRIPSLFVYPEDEK